MLRIHQKRTSKGVAFAKSQTQASSSRSNPRPKIVQPTTSKARSNSPKLRHSHNACATNPSRSSQNPSIPSPNISNRQRRLASLFMAFMASSPLPIETDAETLEAAQKASIAPRARTDTKYKRGTSTVRVQEIRASRWKRFRYQMGSNSRTNGKAKKWDVELDDLVHLRGEERKGDDMA